MKMAASWLADCASHDDCPSQAAVPFPTRLIEIIQEGKECRLHLAAPGEKGHYFTLSHCWGSGVNFVLTKSNIGQLQHAIHVEDLPRSFQDAITITRQLGFRFLWIDAICIIQDSEEDWARQSSLMGGIYRNGRLMISAMAAPDSQHGILRPRNILRSHHFGTNKELVCQTQTESTSAYSTSDQPLHARGWSLQERILAPRILHFGQRELLWECVSKFCAEDCGLADLDPGDEGLEFLTRSASMRFIWPLRQSLEQERQEGSFIKRLTAFYSCVKDFTNRKLTYRTDKLPALSGLASAFHTPELGAYLAGLWEKDLMYGLNWGPQGHIPEDDTHDSGEYIAPSWSWASMLGCCALDDIRDEIFCRPELAVNFQHFNVLFSSTLTPQLLSHHIKLATSDPYGRISDASITLRGHTRLVLVWLDQLEGWESPEYKGVLFDRQCGSQGRGTGFFWTFGPPHENLLPYHKAEFSALSVHDSDNIRQFIALPVGVKAYGKDLALSMLILEPVEGLEDTYRRVGRLGLSESDQMDPKKWEERTLTLI